jgi:hypothetical protein
MSCILSTNIHLMRGCLHTLHPCPFVKCPRYDVVLLKTLKEDRALPFDASNAACESSQHSPSVPQQERRDHLEFGRNARCV